MCRGGERTEGRAPVGRLVVVASTRMGLGRLGSPRYHRINYRSYRAPRFSSGPFVVSLLFVSVPFFSALLPPLPFRLLATRGTPNSPTTVPRSLSSLDRWGRNSTRNWNFREDRFESSGTIDYFFLFRTRRKGKGTHALFLRAISLRSLLVAVVVPFASQPVPTFATRSLLPDAVPLRLVSVRVLFLRASVHTFAHAFSSARLPRHPSSSLKRFFPLRGGSSPRFSSPPTYLPLLFMRAVRSGGGIRVYTRAPALETLIFREIISPRKAVPKRTRDNWTKRDETRRHSNGSIPTVTYIHPDPNNPLCPARCRTDYDTTRDHSILRKRGEEKEREALKNLPTLTAKLPTIEGKALFRGTGEEASDRMPKEERKGKEKESR